MTDPPPLTRRDYLALAGATVTTGIAGCSEQSKGRRSTRGRTTSTPRSTRETSTSPHSPVTTNDHSYENRVDLAEAGADRTGSEPIDEVLREHIEDDTKLVFPEGEYLLEGDSNGSMRITDAENVAFVGEDGATLKAPPNVNGSWFLVDQSRNVAFENIDVDVTANNAAPTLQFSVSTGLSVRDVEVIGRGTRDGSRPGTSGNVPVGNAFMPSVRSSNGHGVIENVVAKTGGRIGTYNQGKGRVGVFVGREHRGTLRIVNSRLEEFPNNGIYGSRTTGVVQVVGGKYENNDISQVRIGSEGSYVRGATIRVDASRVRSPNARADFLNSRGIRIEAGPIQTAGAKVQNCDITIRDVPRSNGGIAVGKAGGRFTIADSRIRIHDDRMRAINVKPPTGGVHPAPPEPHGGEIKRVRISGGANGDAAIKIVDRPKTIVRDCVIEQTGERRQGVHVVRSNDCLITGGSITTTQYPILVEPDTEAAPDTCLLHLDQNVTLESAGRNELQVEDFDLIAYESSTQRSETRCITLLWSGIDGKEVEVIGILAVNSNNIVGVPVTDPSV